jgi:hypothetical protein
LKVTFDGTSTLALMATVVRKLAEVALPASA